MSHPSTMPSRSSLSTSPPTTSKLPKFFQKQSRDRSNTDVSASPALSDDTPVIVEPSRTRTRSERASGSLMLPDMHLYPSASTSKLGEVTSKLSGWLTHSSLPSLLSQPQLPSGSTPLSPRARAAGLLTAARHGKSHLDKTIRYLLDSDSQPDKSTEPIWLMGVLHPGYEPPVSIESTPYSSPSSPHYTQSPSASSSSKLALWPSAFHNDFTSRVWLTYRNSFSPIRDITLASLDADPGGNMSFNGSTSTVASSPQRRWNWGGEKGWTSDSGWGCMLRTGQSMLAEALVHLHLGRDWRKPAHPSATPEYATYVRILTYFFDSTSPLCPFGVHRMALAGKDLGKDVGQWFGPSTAAGAIKTLAHAFPECGLAVSVAVDGVVFESDVYTASCSSPPPSDSSASSHDHRRSRRSKVGLDSHKWGSKAVLVLVGIRLGIEGVNPVYYDCIKTLFTFPQSVGIAGGRPSSSYYFLGYQGDSLFYLDPHHSRPAISLRPPPIPGSPFNIPSPDLAGSALTTPYSIPNITHRPWLESQMSPDSASERERETEGRGSLFSRRKKDHHSHHQNYSNNSTSNVASTSPSTHHLRSPTSPTTSVSTTSSRRTHRSPTPSSTHTSESDFPLHLSDDPIINHYATAYSATELKTFHCEKVRKMPIASMDPSMLLGFLCKSEEEWRDFRKRVGEMGRRYKVIFSIQDEPPSWPDEFGDEMGMESVSEPDIDLEGEFASTDLSRSLSHSAVATPGPEVDTFDEDQAMGNISYSNRSQQSFKDGREKLSVHMRPPGDADIDAHVHAMMGGSSSRDSPSGEDDQGPITPGPSSRFPILEDDDDMDVVNIPKAGQNEEEDIDDDEWVDPTTTPVDTPFSSPNANGKPRNRDPDHRRLSSSTISRETKSPHVAFPPQQHPNEPTRSQQPIHRISQTQYPFPLSSESESDSPNAHSQTIASLRGEERTRKISGLRSAKARDGGRTKSGGIKGIRLVE